MIPNWSVNDVSAFGEKCLVRSNKKMSRRRLLQRRPFTVASNQRDIRIIRDTLSKSNRTRPIFLSVKIVVSGFTTLDEDRNYLSVYVISIYVVRHAVC